MTISRLILVTLLSVGLAMTPTFSPYFVRVAHAQQAEKASLTEITNAVEALTVRLITAVRRSDSASLKPDDASGKIVWTSLRNLNQSIEMLANGAALQDASFHSGLEASVRNMAAAATALESSEHGDEKVTEAKNKLIDALGKLQENFSKAAARKKQGDELTSAEKKKLEQIKSKHSELKRKLEKVEKKVQRNKKATKGVRVVHRHVDVIIGAGPTLSDYLAVLIAIEIIDGIIWGWHWWWGPWGILYDDYSIGMIGLHDEIMTDIAYDWAEYQDLAVDVSDIDIAADFEEGELDEASAALDENTFDLTEGLDDASLDGVEAMTDADFQDPDFAPLTEVETGAMEEDLAPEAGAIEADNSIAEEFEAPEPAPAPEPEPEFEPAPEPVIEPDTLPADDFGGSDFDASDFGGDLGGLDGGFDF